MPVLMLLVWGVKALGLSGVLLPVGVPVRTWAVPVEATLLNARLKVRRAVLLPVFEIWHMSSADEQQA